MDSFGGDDGSPEVSLRFPLVMEVGLYITPYFSQKVAKTKVVTLLNRGPIKK